VASDNLRLTFPKAFSEAWAREKTAGLVDWSLRPTTLHQARQHTLICDVKKPRLSKLESVVNLYHGRTATALINVTVALAAPVSRQRLTSS
jgi:hypothetical protein